VTLHLGVHQRSDDSSQNRWSVSLSKALGRAVGYVCQFTSWLAKIATVRNCLMPGFQHYVRCIRFRDRFRNPCPHCRSVAPLLFPYCDANGYGINITRSYMNGNGERYFLRKLRILTDERNSYVFLKRNTEIRLGMNGKVTLETRGNCRLSITMQISIVGLPIGHSVMLPGLLYTHCCHSYGHT